LERFGEACKMIQQLNASNITKPLPDHAFDILGEVAQGDFTKWSIVYDISNKRILFKTDQVKQLRYLNFSSFDFSCKQTTKTIDINTVLKDDISSKMTDFNSKLNSRIIDKTLLECRSRITIPDPQKQALKAYNSTIHCE